MANYFRNELIIRGTTQSLKQFQGNALPKENEQADESWCGHCEGPLSFLSLLPPPDKLRAPGANEEEAHGWRRSNWGCIFPEADDCILKGDCLGYWFLTRDFCAHDFVVNVSKAYPELAFRLIWNDPYSGSYGGPKQYALLAVKGGAISMDYVELSAETVSCCLDELDEKEGRSPLAAGG